MAASWLHRAGHKPIILVGGGTALVGDPTGRSLERNMEPSSTIDGWAGSLRRQVERFVGAGAVILDNSEWLRGLNYIEFLRDTGIHFSVNRMLTADSVRLRLEKGLSFLEFNYMLLQAYDFLHLHRTRGCLLQIGGADQWGNIVAGVELVRRADGHEVFGLTCPLVTTSTGEKMSKSAPGGAVWLDPAMTSPYGFYQFWINVDDRDAVWFTKLYTFVPMPEIEAMSSLRGEELNEVKRRLAWEVTAIVHGSAEADRARDASEALFRGRGEDAAVPSTELALSALREGRYTFLDLFEISGLCPTRSESRRLARQGGLSAGSLQITRPETPVSEDMLEDGSIMLRVGRKRHHRIDFRDQDRGRA
jgi:tyrosyl-tRNA synthetase